MRILGVLSAAGPSSEARAAEGAQLTLIEQLPPATPARRGAPLRAAGRVRRGRRDASRKAAYRGRGPGVGGWRLEDQQVA